MQRPAVLRSVKACNRPDHYVSGSRSAALLTAPRAVEAGTSGVAWLLFLLLNATLFMRPAEIVPQLEGWPIYNAIILCCLALALPQMLQRLQGRSLLADPITLCVFGILPAIVLSLLAQGDTW